MNRTRRGTAAPRGAVLALALTASVAAVPATADAAQAQARLRVDVENPIALERPSETVALPWGDLQRRLRGLRADRVRVLDASTRAEVVSQVLDVDADGAADSLLFQADFWSGQRRGFVVEAAAPAAPHQSRAYAYHDEPRDDVAWETDRVAYRMYGQGLWQASEYQPLVSSGIDVWPKRTRELIVDRWYAKGHDAYHLDTGEGADFYTVGPTLGAGGTAIWRDGTLHRAKNFKAHRILARGPIRALFELEYEPWDAGGIQVSETKRISMDAGQNLFRQEVIYRAPVGEVEYAAGTVKRDGLVGSSRHAGRWAWSSTWGPVERKNGGHGSLGTAVLLPVDGLVATRELDDHYVAVARARAGTPAVQYAGAGWTASGDFRSVEDWWAYLDRFAERLENPLRVTWGDAAGSAR